MFWQQRMTPVADPAQQKVMMLTPIMFLVFFLWAPSGLVLYWLMSNLIGIGQQYATNHLIGKPVVKAPRPAAAREFFDVLGRYAPPPPLGARPPLLWGDEDHVRALFGNRVTSLEMTAGNTWKQRQAHASTTTCSSRHLDPWWRFERAWLISPIAWQRWSATFSPSWRARTGRRPIASRSLEYLLVVAREGSRMAPDPRVELPCEYYDARAVLFDKG